MHQHETFWQDLKSGKFASMVKESARGQELSNSREAYNVLKPLFLKEPDVECLYGIFMNAKNRIITIEKLFTGSITSSSVYPREIVKKVLAHHSTAIVMAHNHPSGNIQPSPEDRSITVKVFIALNCIDASLHDHLIIADRYFSMADAGWIKEMADRHLKWNS